MILVEAAWQETSGVVRTAAARMENRSAHGACIRIKERVGVGARVYIQSHREQFSGIVKYCRVVGKDFLVGIERDTVNRPVPKRPAVEKAAEREESSAREIAAAMPEQEKAQREERVRNEARAPRWAERPPTRPRESAAKAPSVARVETPIVERLMVAEARSRESPRSEMARAALRQPARQTLPRVLPAAVPQAPVVEAAPAAAVERKQATPEKKLKKGRGFMKLKWFAGNEEEDFGANGGSNAASEPAQQRAATEVAPRRERAVAAAEEDGGFHAELLAMEDIYRSAGITSPRRGYSIGKVVEMLRSEHLRGQSKEVRRAAVLMALDAAGVSANEVIQDARVRQEAIDAYAAEQRKHAESQWARKAEENLQIQAELELVKSHYAERIRRNLDGVAREKATFGSWLKMKEQETQGMTEAVEQVLKAPAPAEPPGDPLLSVTPASVTAKPV
jgi:hypothetical protein